MSEHDAIELRGVSVSYRLHRVLSIKELMIRRVVKRDTDAARVHALRDVSLHIRPGESVGIVGGNGAGKSTLLRVAAGIVTPTQGEVWSRGTMAPLLELGTGFEAELSGRENIFFNGALLGRSRPQMQSHLDEIIAFSGLDRFIDAPLRTYSTGMVARLAFSIATAVDADTILLDEILAVGDAAFRERCDERIQRFLTGGATVVLVSHELEVIRRLCRRTVWVAQGSVVADGASDDVIDRYEQERHAAAVAAS
jgi:ABC-type polysaccharide/polyol phosphate transport system ATPase subunit